MGLTAKRVTEDIAEKIARASALLGRVRFPSAEVKAALSVLREVRAPSSPKPKPTDGGQVPIPLPERPLQIEADSIVEGCPLHSEEVRACVCVARQCANEAKTGLALGTMRRGKGGRNSTAKKRGVSLEHPSCVTERCALGRRVRAALGDDASVGVKHGKRSGRDYCAQMQRMQKAKRANYEPASIDDTLPEWDE